MSAAKRMIRAALIGPIAAAIATSTAGAVVPANGGDAGGSIVTVNNGPGDQSEPHASGDLAVYTNRDSLFPASGWTIHYFDFLTAIDHVVPAGAPGDLDVLPDVDGQRIVFSRSRAVDGQAAVMLLRRRRGLIVVCLGAW